MFVCARMCVCFRGVVRGWLTTLDSPFLTASLTGSLERKREKGDVNFCFGLFCFSAVYKCCPTLFAIGSKRITRLRRCKKESNISREKHSKEDGAERLLCSGSFCEELFVKRRGEEC